MPYPSEHAARVVSPSTFEKDSFRRKVISPGVTIIVGKKKGESKTTVQAYRFDKSKFTAEQAKKWLKDHEVKNMSFEKATDVKENELQEGDGTLAERSEYYVPWGVKSFGDLQSYRQTKEAAEDLNELVSDFQSLASNIVNDAMVEDKKAALASLVQEFVSMLNIENAMSDEEIAAGESELSEAATVKASAVAAIKALENLLSTKDLPSTLTKQMEEMKGALKKKWADLKDEKDSEEPVEDEEACKTDKKKKMKENEEELVESYAGILEVVELSEAGTSSLLEMDVQLIRPGWGNAKDGHYYSGDMLKSYAEKFVGAKMYETDHKANEKSTRTWVSTVKEIKGYTDDGAPIAKVAVHDPNFAERMRNLKAAGLVEKMECSILANGTAKVGEVGGKKGKIVESITDVSSVDWVTRAGAGGHALALAESSEGGSDMGKEKDVLEEASTTDAATTPEPVAEAGEETTQPTRLSESQVTEVLAKSKLPDASKERLQESEYVDEAALQEAVTKEVAYVKKITKSGQPFGLGDTQAPEAARMTESEREEKINGVFNKYGLGG